MGALLVCPECAFEWSPAEAEEAIDTAVVKDLKVKGQSQAIKVGTKVRNIRLVDGVGDHDIDCKVEGFGPMQLKSSVVKKA